MDNGRFVVKIIAEPVEHSTVYTQPDQLYATEKDIIRKYIEWEKADIPQGVEIATR